MNTNDQKISNAIEELEANLSEASRVEDWAELMGYNCPKKFARRFLRYYSVRPIRMLEYIRLKSITRQLRKSSLSNFEIARQHGISDESWPLILRGLYPFDKRFSNSSGYTEFSLRV